MVNTRRHPLGLAILRLIPTMGPLTRLRRPQIHQHLCLLEPILHLVLMVLMTQR
jgi:hypothetical protein